VRVLWRALLHAPTRCMSCANTFLSLVVRMIRYRIKDATLIPVDDTLTMVSDTPRRASYEATLVPLWSLTVLQIHVPDCDSGWLPTQHVLLRVMKGSGIFESHPFTITNAPSSSLSSTPRGIILYAKVCGDWTRRLHSLARDVATLEEEEDAEEREKFIQDENEGKASVGGMEHPGKRVTVMIDGPYGGLKLDLGEYEAVLLVAGGSGITFVLGAIEEAIRVKEAGRGPSKVEVAWVVRDMSE
jgi:ferric-chelate reductase